MDLHRQITSLVVLAGTTLFAMSVSAQEWPRSPGMDEESRNEFAEIIERLRTGSLLVSLEKSRANQRDVVDVKGDPFNPVLSASALGTDRRRRGLGSAGVEAPERVSECINPPVQRRARYVVAYVNVAPRADVISSTGTGFELDEEGLAENVDARFMPDKVRDDQPGVAIMVNVGEKQWAYHLDDDWKAPKTAREWITSTVDAETDHEEAACEVANAVETLLEQAESSSISDVLRRKQLRERLQSIRADFDGLRTRIEQDVSDTQVYRNRIRPALQTTEEKLALAAKALDAGRYDEAGEALEKADETSSRANSTYLGWMSLETKAREAQARLDEHASQTAFRRTSWLPFGEELQREFDTCEAEVSTFRELMRDGASMRRASDQRSRASHCLQQFGKLRGSTREQFDLYVYYMPGAGLALIFLLGSVLVGRRRGRSQTLRYELATTLSEWEQKVPLLHTRLEHLKRQHERILEGDEARALDAGLTRDGVDVVDRAFALGATARELLDEAQRLQSAASTLSAGPLEDALELLTEGSTELSTSSTSNLTPIRRGVREREVVEHAELLEKADSLGRRADALLDDLEPDEPDTPQGW